MVHREFRAKVTEDFKNKWLRVVALNEDITIEKAEEYYGGKNLDQLDDRISGKIVTILENRYAIGETDFFEKEDNNFVIDSVLFTEIKN